MYFTLIGRFTPTFFWVLYIHINKIENKEHLKDPGRDIHRSPLRWLFPRTRLFRLIIGLVTLSRMGLRVILYSWYKYRKVGSREFYSKVSRASSQARWLQQLHFHKFLRPKVGTTILVHFESNTNFTKRLLIFPLPVKLPRPKLTGSPISRNTRPALLLDWKLVTSSKVHLMDGPLIFRDHPLGREASSQMNRPTPIFLMPRKSPKSRPQLQASKASNLTLA